MIRIVDVTGERSCRTLCYMEPNCVSYNFNRDARKCELNNSTSRDGKKLWRPILIIYTLELRYNLSVYLWEISCESSHPLRKYCSLRPSSPFEDIVKNRPTRGTRENTRKRPLARLNRRACSQARTIDGCLFSFHVPERL